MLIVKKENSGKKIAGCIEKAKYTEGKGTRYFGIIDCNHWEDINAKGFVQFITEDKVIDFVKEHIETTEDEDYVEWEDEIEEIKEMIDSGETDLESYCFKHSDFLLGNSGSIVELYKVENEENIFTYSHDSKEYRLEIFSGDYFVKEIK